MSKSKPRAAANPQPGAGRPGLPAAAPPKSPLERRSAWIRAEADRLAAERQALDAIRRGLSTLRAALAAFPELRPLIAEELGLPAVIPPGDDDGAEPAADPGEDRREDAGEMLRRLAAAIRSGPAADDEFTGKGALVRGEIPLRFLTVLSDRVEWMARSGVIEVVEDESPNAVTGVSLTWPEILVILRGLLPELFPADPPEPDPTDTPPASEARVGVYAKRVEGGEAVFSDGDATADDGRGLAVVPRKGGSGRNREKVSPKVAGWKPDKAA